MSRGISRAKAELGHLRAPRPAICSSCATRRHAATAAAVSSHDPSVPLSQDDARRDPVVSTATRTDYLVRAGIVLSRAPQITRDLSSFEKAFFLYQRRMNERTAMPFHRYFYIQKETPADIDWKRKIKVRKTPARDIGNWSAWDREEGWNDELLIGSTISEPSEHMRLLLEDAKLHEDAVDEEVVPEEKDIIEQPQPRVSDADQKNDTKSLNRSLTRTLYLVVKPKDGRWQFPSALVEGQESVHRAAERVIVQTGGINMNTWIVGNAPIGYHTWNYANPQTNQESGLEHIGEKTFFMKGRILAGKPDLKLNEYGFRDHQWLSREEVQKIVNPSYWGSIKNMLPSL